MTCNLREFKEFIDNEMIIILGQMDSPTEIFDHVFLVGWGRSGVPLLQLGPNVCLITLISTWWGTARTVLLSIYLSNCMNISCSVHQTSCLGNLVKHERFYFFLIWRYLVVVCFVHMDVRQALQQDLSIMKSSAQGSELVWLLLLFPAGIWVECIQFGGVAEERVRRGTRDKLYWSQ